MEIGVVNPQAVLQMYHCKDYPWRAVASPTMAADKETIIANADFTTTSAIARRRLSSKKRKKPDSSGDASSSDSSAGSPTGSLGSPSRNCVTSTTHTLPVRRSENGFHRTLTNLPTTNSAALHLPSHHTVTHQVVPPHPQATATIVVVPHGVTGPETSVSQQQYVPLVPAAACNLAPVRPTGSSVEPRAFAHPMYSHLQQELNYRYLQDQSGPSSMQHGNGGTAAFSAPHSQAGKISQQNMMATSAPTSMDTAAGSSEGSQTHRVKWCSAHITIAKQIQAHQQQTKNALEVSATHPLVPESCSGGAKPNPGAGSVDAAQHMALLQMYGMPTTALPGYMAMPGVPYSMPEMQLHNLSFVPHTAQAAQFVDTANMLSVKPMTAVAASQATDSNIGVQMMNGVQLLPYGQSLPMAAIMPNGMSNLVQGSYIGPVPVIGNCVVNPCQPGVMVAPWVR